MMTDAEVRAIVARLKEHKALGVAPTSEHEWLARHGSYLTYPKGVVVNTKGTPVKVVFIVLAGHLVIRVDRGAGAHKIIEWNGGDVGGLLPFSRGATPPADAIAETVMEVLEIPQVHVPEMIRECPVVTGAMVHAMVDRARLFTTSDQRDEKLLSLGRLAAGLAHELNNPASAAVRGAKTLGESLEAAETAARHLGAARLTDAQLAAIDALHTRCRDAGARPPLSSMERSDREEAIEAWLGAHDANEACAAPLTESGVTVETLETLAASVAGDALDAALRWIAAGCAVRTLTADIKTAASRIYDIVGAVKGFTYMDHAPTPEPVDIRRGINDTLTMLTAKSRAKNVNVAVQFADDLPSAHAVGVELNQVWMNLIDNAIDAVAKGGHVSVTAGQELGRVVVEVADDGAGIPPTVLGRIFDPFFTTKPVGQGTGLGLDIVRRLVQRHEGTIDVTSRPGHTAFRVSVPAATSRPHAGA
ncbi:MAG: ATP-binding protein [Gemmatimonadota bacterium]